jgi:hypothetical protein
MANTTAWTGGTLNSGLGWTTAISSSDMASLAGGKAVLSSGPVFTNGTGLDQLVDFSFIGAIASTTLTAGASMAIYLYMLLQDGATYGDNAFSGGTGSTHTITATIIGQSPFAYLPMSISGGGVTVISGQANGAQQGLWIPPGSFLFGFANNLLPSTALSSGTQSLYFRTYNQNLNR